MESVRRQGAAIVTAAAAASLCSALLTGGAAAAGLSAAAGAPAATSAGTWHKAQEVPGTAALHTGGSAGTGSVSCASAGNCSADGGYEDRSGHYQVFVVSEVKGKWGKAAEVPGTAALNVGGRAGIGSVSCASAGNCGAGGWYHDRSGHSQAFVASQVNGTWRKAQEVPGTAALNAGGLADVGPISCGSAGNCSAGGQYADGSGATQAFVASQVKGTWRMAVEVPGTAALNAGGNAWIGSVSCASAGNCSAAGSYTVAASRRQVFVVSEVKGIWRKAQEVPGTAALNTGGFAWIGSVSCASAGNCSAGGEYADAVSYHLQAFVISEVKGTWRKAQEVPGTAALNTGEGAGIDSVSCASAGNCSAGGWYQNRFGHSQAFVVSEVKGIWRKAQEVPGTTALNAGGDAGIGSVSCASAGNCGAGGTYQDHAGHQQVFVVSEVKGTWGKAEEVPGTAKLNTGGSAGIDSVSCASAGSCSAGGYYTNGSDHEQAFVVSEVR